MASRLVTITGLTGFIAAHTAAQLLSRGYRVRGTVRTTTNATDNPKIMALPGAADRLDIVEADLLTEGSYDVAVTGAETAIRWWQSKGEDPRQKLVIFSDGLDVEKIEELHRKFNGRVKVSFGWGTMLTNDFRGLVPGDRLAPFSLVCKAVAANGHPTVKLSDNPNKAMGPADEIERYKRVFGVGKQVAQAVSV